jgi:hypothetical protein
MQHAKPIPRNFLADAGARLIAMAGQLGKVRMLSVERHPSFHRILFSASQHFRLVPSRLFAVSRTLR